MPKKYPPVKVNFEVVREVIEKAGEKPWGNIVDFERAIGALIVGQIFGWKVLRILHSKNAYAKYEKILGIRFTDVCPDTTNQTYRSVGYQYATGQISYWELIKKGLIPVEKRTQVKGAGSSQEGNDDSGVPLDGEPQT